jgi:hypothetical protein
VSVGTASVQTDTSGNFSLSVGTAQGKVIQFTKTGFAATYKSLDNFPGTDIRIDALLKQVDWQVKINPGTENIITSPSGASVTIPVLTGIGEDLIVSLTSFDVSTDEIDAAPGDFSAVDQSGSQATLASAGMIDVDIKGAVTGNSYSLASGTEIYQIAIPITCVPLGTLPATIDRWYFDRATCKWIYDGSLTKSGNFYTGMVKHFSTYNADFKVPETGCISGVIADPGHQGGSLYSIHIDFNYEGLSYHKAYTQTDTVFSVLRLPLNTPILVTVFGYNTGIGKSNTVTITSGTSCANAGTFDLTYPDIAGVTYSKTRNSITINWAYEPPALDNLLVTYWKAFDTIPVVQSYTVSAGTYSTTISSLDQTVYTFRIQAESGVHASSGYSFTTRFADSYTLTVVQTRMDDLGDAFDIYVYLNGSATGQLYASPVSLPLNTQVKLHAELKPGFAGDYEYYWYGNPAITYDNDPSICYVNMSDDLWLTICSYCPR